MVSGFFFIPKAMFSLIFSLTAQKTRTSAGTGPLKTKIVFMLCYQYSRIGRENQSQGFIPVSYTHLVLDCGVNIHDKKLRHIVLAADNQTTFIQCIGRKRLDSNETLQVHVLEMNSKTLAGRRASITRKLNLAQRFDAGNHLDILDTVSYTHLDVYKRQIMRILLTTFSGFMR